MFGKLLSVLITLSIGTFWAGILWTGTLATCTVWDGTVCKGTDILGMGWGWAVLTRTLGDNELFWPAETGTLKPEMFFKGTLWIGLLSVSMLRAGTFPTEQLLEGTLAGVALGIVTHSVETNCGVLIDCLSSHEFVTFTEFNSGFLSVGIRFLSGRVGDWKRWQKIFYYTKMK